MYGRSGPPDNSRRKLQSSVRSVLRHENALRKDGWAATASPEAPARTNAAQRPIVSVTAPNPPRHTPLTTAADVTEARERQDTNTTAGKTTKTHFQISQELSKLLKMLKLVNFFKIVKKI